eukprot:CAMPEP_0202462034 /NCGR_PEP_ID=MMETSP1360-20130828/52090_1 /ASSEMBLY_ACC=CAM_ASM_000848 /TAXON_ID=515479 /ORGANISM="Licmophora paradoxa, Strain CCMP2313" /LENGTH=139 /DNA_ID=CAMNT_0049084329 /DNA_START=87 /DNA_END=504 /DNA_ORIENTATION=+
MNTTTGFHNPTELPHLQRKTRVLKGRLHFLPPKESEIAPPLGGRAVALGSGEFFESGTQFFRRGGGLPEDLDESLQFFFGLLEGAGDLGVPPGGGPAGGFVFFENVEGPDFFGFFAAGFFLGGGWNDMEEEDDVVLLVL